MRGRVTYHVIESESGRWDFARSQDLIVQRSPSLRSRAMIKRRTNQGPLVASLANNQFILQIFLWLFPRLLVQFNPAISKRYVENINDKSNINYYFNPVCSQPDGMYVFLTKGRKRTPGREHSRAKFVTRATQDWKSMKSPHIVFHALLLSGVVVFMMFVFHRPTQSVLP